MIGYIIGCDLHRLSDKYLELQHKIHHPQPSPQDDPPRKSVVFDPDDIGQMAKYEQEALMKRINPPTKGVNDGAP